MTTTAPAAGFASAAELPAAAPAAPANLVFRNDTILGVCEALGQDFGFNPNWLRIAFCAPIYWNPALVIGAYLALGLIVAAARFAFPDRIAAIPAAGPAPQLAVAVAQPEASGERELVAA